MTCKNCEIVGCDYAGEIGSLKDALKLAVGTLHRIQLPDLVYDDAASVLTGRMILARETEARVKEMTGIDYYKDCFEFPFSPRMTEPE